VAVLNIKAEFFLKQQKICLPNPALIMTVMALLLTACGYHLRGAYQLPQALKSVYLQGASIELRDQFNKALQASSGQLIDSPGKARIVIRFFDEKLTRRVMSLSARGRANEFELDYRLDYEISNAGNAILMPRQSLQVKREYFNDQQDVIAKDNEEKVIRNEMYQQTVRAILNRARLILEASAK
jgi:LPS-assembly lipoprotein